MAVHPPTKTLASSVACFRDTCNVYVLRSGGTALLVDFGSGAVLDRLDELGVERATDVLVTHHHRDQVQGLARARDAGLRIWVPPVEEELIAGVDTRWRTRQLDNDYDLREDRFSLLEQVDVAGAVAEYRTTRYGAFDVYALPTPGHTLGSVTYLVEVDGRLLAFCGDLVYGDGQVWSLAATQWTYSGVEGWAATIISCNELLRRGPDALLPSHGDPIEEPRQALERASERMQKLIDLRLPSEWNVAERVREPFDAVTPHLLRNRTMFANNYALLSDDGAALLIDFGYDVTTTATGSERAARRTLLWSLDALRREFAIDSIDAAVVTHYHDDHVAGLNLLREVEGAEVWAPANVAPVLEEPARYDLPCLWFDPIRVDRALPLGEPIRWREYELTLHALPGHTLYAAAIGFEVDGKRVLATGDQQTNDDGRSILNYQYRNRFSPDDFVRSAELYGALRPDLLIGGHWLPRAVDEGYLDTLLADARRLAELHRELLPDDAPGATGFVARIEPYRSRVQPGAELDLDVRLSGPLGREEAASVRLVLPAGWSAVPAENELALAGRGDDVARFRVRVGGEPVRRARIAADVTIGETRFGQQAEALVDVE